MKRAISILLLLGLSACPRPSEPKQPGDDPGPADDGGTDGGETGDPPKPSE
jgi:hypothetical protein